MSPHIAAVVHKAMAIARKQRPESALAMRRELQVANEDDERAGAGEEVRRAEARLQHSYDTTIENIQASRNLSEKSTEQFDKRVADPPPAEHAKRPETPGIPFPPTERSPPSGSPGTCFSTCRFLPLLKETKRTVAPIHQIKSLWQNLQTLPPAESSLRRTDTS